MPIAISSRRSHAAVPQAQLASQSWTYESPLGGPDSLSEDEQLPPRSRSEDGHACALPSKLAAIWASSVSFDEEPVDLSGPFSVEMLGAEVLGASRKVIYTLRVTGSDGDHVVRRRYSSFARLSAAVAVQLSKPLPPMPPKSFFRKRLSLGFMQERSQCLVLIAMAAVAADPQADTDVVRQFLGLVSQEGGKHAGPDACCGVATLASQWGRRMETITEAEYESSIQGSHLFSSLEGSKLESCIAGPDTWSLISDTWKSGIAGPAHLGCVEEGLAEECGFDGMGVHDDPGPIASAGMLPEAPASYEHIE